MTSSSPVEHKPQFGARQRLQALRLNASISVPTQIHGPVRGDRWFALQPVKEGGHRDRCRYQLLRQQIDELRKREASGKRMGADVVNMSVKSSSV